MSNRWLALLIAALLIPPLIPAQPQAFDQNNKDTWNYGDREFYNQVDWDQIDYAKIQWDKVDFNQIPDEHIQKIPVVHFDPGKFTTDAGKAKLKSAVAAQIEPNLGQFENLLATNDKQLKQALDQHFGANIDLSMVGEIIMTYNAEIKLLQGDFPWYDPSQFPAGGFVQRIVTDEVTGETQVIIEAAGEVDRAVALSGAGTLARDTETGAMTATTGAGSPLSITGALDAAQPIRIIETAGGGSVSGFDTFVSYDDGKKTITGTFEKTGEEVLLKSYDGKQSTFSDAAAGTKVESVGYDLVVLPFGAKPSAFRGVRNQVAYDAEHVFAIGRFDVQHGGSFEEGGFRVTSKADAAVFNSETGIAAGLVRYEDAHIAYEGHAASVWSKLTSDERATRVEVHGGEELSGEGGALPVVAGVQQKVRIGDLRAEDGIIVGDGRLTFFVVNNQGKLETVLDPATAQFAADIDKDPAAVAFLDRELHLSVGKSVTEVSAGLGVVYDADADDPANNLVEVLSPIKTHFYMGNDLETVQEIVRRDTAGGAFEEAFLGVEKLYEIQRKAFLAPDGEFDASIASLDKTKAFITEAYPEGAGRDAAFATFTLGKLQRIAEDVAADNPVQLLMYESIVRNDLREVRGALDRADASSGGAVRDYLRGEDETSGNLGLLFQRIGQEAAVGADDARRLKQSLQAQLSNEYAYERLASDFGERERGFTPEAEAWRAAGQQHRIDSLRALVSLEETAITTVEGGARVARDTGTFSSPKLLLGSALAQEYARAGRVQDALAALRELESGFTAHVTRLPDDLPAGAMEVLQKQASTLEAARKEIQRVGFNRITLAVFAREKELSAVLDQLGEGAVSRALKEVETGLTPSAGASSESGAPRAPSSSATEMLAVFLSYPVRHPIEGGYLTETLDALGAFSQRKAALSALSEETRAPLKGSSAIALLAGAGVSPQTIDTWIKGENVEADIIGTVMGRAGAVPAPPGTEAGNPRMVALPDGRVYVATDEQRELGRLVFEAIEDLRPAARLAYDSSAYGNEIKEIIGLRTIASASGSYQAAEPSDRLAGVEREFRQKLAAIEPSRTEEIVRWVDEGLSPLAVTIGAVTGGVGGTFFSRATGAAGAALGVVENVAIDAATGTVLVTAGVKPEEHPALAMATGVGIGLGTGVPRVLNGIARSHALQADDYARALADGVGADATVVQRALRGVDVQDPAAVARALGAVTGAEVRADVVRTVIERQRLGTALAGVDSASLSALGLGKRGADLVDGQGRVISSVAELEQHVEGVGVAVRAEGQLARAREVMSGDHVTTIKNNQLGVLTQRPIPVEVTLPSGAQIVIEPASAGQDLRLLAMAQRLKAEVPADAVFATRGDLLSIEGYHVPRPDEVILFKGEGAGGYFTSHEIDFLNTFSAAQGLRETLIRENLRWVDSSTARALDLAKGRIENGLHLIDLERTLGVSEPLAKMDAGKKQQIVNQLLERRIAVREKNAFHPSGERGPLDVHTHPASPDPFGTFSPIKPNALDAKVAMVMGESPFDTRYWTLEEAASVRALARQQLPDEIAASERLVEALQSDLTFLETRTPGIDTYRIAVGGALREGSGQDMQHLLRNDVLISRLAPRFDGQTREPLAPQGRLLGFLRLVETDPADFAGLIDNARGLVQRDIDHFTENAQRAREALDIVRSGSDRELFFKAVPRTLTPSPQDVGHLLGKDPITLTVGGKPVQIRAGVIVFPHGTTYTIIEEGSDTVQLVRVLEDQPQTLSSPAGARPFRAEVESVPLSAFGIRKEDVASGAAASGFRLPQQAPAPTPQPLVPKPPPRPLEEIRREAQQALADVNGRLGGVLDESTRALLESQSRLLRQVEVSTEQGMLLQEINNGVHDGTHFRAKGVLLGHPEGVVEGDVPGKGAQLSSDMVHVSPDGHVVLVDIAGHGDPHPVPRKAALPEFEDFIKEQVLPSGDGLFEPAQFDALSRMAERISEREAGDAFFATVTAAKLFPDGRMQLLSSMDEVYIVQRDGGVRRINMGGPPIGIPQIRFNPSEVHTTTLPPGDKLVIMTDGLRESLNAAGGEGAPVSDDGFNALVREIAEAEDPEKVVRNHVQEQIDDITVLVIERK